MIIASIVCTGCNEQHSDESVKIISPKKNEVATLYIVGSSTMELMYEDFVQQSTLYDIHLNNYAQSGEKIYTNCLRLGALSGNVKFSSELLESNKNNYLTTDWPIDLAMRPFEVSINNIKGSLHVDNQGYYFKPYSDYQTTKVELNIFYPIISTFKPENNSIFILNLGKNNLLSNEDSDIESNFKSCTDFIYYNYSEKIYLINHFTSTTATENLIKKIEKFNTYIKTISTTKHLDLNKYLMSAEIWTESNITPSQQDLENQSNLKLPPSLSKDNIHLNNKTNTIITSRVYQDLIKFKWIQQKN